MVDWNMRLERKAFSSGTRRCSRKSACKRVDVPGLSEHARCRHDSRADCAETDVQLTVGQICDAPVPQVVKELVEVQNTLQERVPESIDGQIVDEV